MGVVETAKSYIGKVQYVFGADDLDNGVADCSSFTQAVFKKHGYEIGRNTESQWGKGMYVDRASIKPGDLVFFRDTYNSSYKDGVSHVGIAIGGSEFVHCSSSKGVTVSDLNSSYYDSHYLGAKRIDGANVSEGSSSEGSGASTGSGGSPVHVKWWGDIVTIVLSILLVITGIGLLAVGVKTNVFSGGN